jgi:hypothetical protein
LFKELNSNVSAPFKDCISLIIGSMPNSPNKTKIRIKPPESEDALAKAK